MLSIEFQTQAKSPPCGKENLLPTNKQSTYMLYVCNQPFLVFL